eukprot:TRINITY_DN4662_c0_g1_i1.p1 TRINITY_DN4662_c0_g1~~TRINITY_DN4662_c0_g1_i1.p1  ORF type:complete len:242 (+),score=39.67 TRINITY_DN4662_c0_g1_i1:748-1473(+)
MMLVFLITIIIIIGVSGENSPVIELKQDNFQHSISSGLWFVEFYAPWCGHCNKLAHVWEELADHIQSDPDSFKSVNIAKVNCDEQTSICTAQQIKGYPTILLFNDGVSKKYAGGRTKQEFLNYLTHMSRPAVEEILSSQIQNIIKDDDNVNIILINKNKEDSDLHDIFYEIAREVQSIISPNFWDVSDRIKAGETLGITLPEGNSLVIANNGVNLVYSGPIEKVVLKSLQLWNSSTNTNFQ